MKRVSKELKNQIIEYANTQDKFKKVQNKFNALKNGFTLLMNDWFEGIDENKLIIDTDGLTKEEITVTKVEKDDND